MQTWVCHFRRIRSKDIIVLMKKFKKYQTYVIDKFCVNSTQIIHTFKIIICIPITYTVNKLQINMYEVVKKTYSLSAQIPLSVLRDNNSQLQLIKIRGQQPIAFVNRKVLFSSVGFVFTFYLRALSGCSHCCNLHARCVYALALFFPPLLTQK